MTRLGRNTAAAIVLIILLSPFSFAGKGFQREQNPRSVETGRYWVFLEPETYSPAELQRALDETANSLTPRSLARRSKVIFTDPPIRICDLPISQERLASIEESGCEIVRHMRYLNAVVVKGSQVELDRVRGLSFVKNVTSVLAWSVTGYNSESKEVSSQAEKPSLPIEWNDEEYGYSLRQSQLVNLPPVHNLGYHGNGVLIGVQDTGFDNLIHHCYAHLDVVAAWDFLNNDDDVSDQGDRGSGSHGCRTLSVIAALDTGRFIGAAPEAQFILTKTEDSEGEYELEEDLWVAGLWFHDSLGVDVLSSSLSYRNWYDWEQMDGQTAITTRAADSAAAAGIVIVNSVGNTGNRIYPDTKIGAPADSRFVISVGGVRSNDEYWSSASQGPTYDGRIKPDVSAQAYNTYTCSNYTDSTYRTSSGTSFSTPMVAGIAALVLEANPELTPAQVMSILHETASQADDPDTLIGYGVVDALAAVILAEQMAGVSSSILLPSETGFTAYPNPFNGILKLAFEDGFTPDVLSLYNLSGRRILRLERSGAFYIPQAYNLDLSNLSSGTYYIRARQGERNIFKAVILLK